MNETNNNLEIEASVVISSIERAMISDDFNYKIDYNNQEVGDLGPKLQIDGSVSRFNIPAGSFNVTSKECLKNASVGIEPDEATTKYSDTEKKIDQS